METTDKFLGRRKISFVVDSALKTTLGSDIVEVHFEDGSIEITTKRAFNLQVTDSAMEGNNVDDDLMHRKLSSLLREVQMLMMEYDIKVKEMSPFMKQLGFNLDDAMARAVNYLWTKDDMKHTPGGDVLSDKSLLEAQAILMSIPKEETRDFKLAKIKENESTTEQESPTGEGQPDTGNPAD